MSFVSIHAPLTGGDRADHADPNFPIPRFNPRPPHGRRLAVIRSLYDDALVSIHAPLTGGDAVPSFQCVPPTRFQSTPPSREATPRSIEAATGK